MVKRALSYARAKKQPHLPAKNIQKHTHLPKNPQKIFILPGSIAARPTHGSGHCLSSNHKQTIPSREWKRQRSRHTRIQSPASKHIAPAARICGCDTRAIETAASASAIATFWKSMVVARLGLLFNESDGRGRRMVCLKKWRGWDEGHEGRMQLYLSYTYRVYTS